MSESAKVRLGQSSVGGPEAPGRGQVSNIVTKWPSKENALIVKLVCDPTYDNGRKIFRPAKYYDHQTGTGVQDKGSHICQTFFGAESSPENDEYWVHMNAYSKLKKAGKVTSAEALKAKEMWKTFKAKNKGWLFVVQPGSKLVQAVKIPESVIDVLMGRKADDFHKTETVSIIQTMTTKGQSPFDLNIENGWLKLYITGEGINTKYFVEVAEVDATAETKDGKKINYKEDYTGKVSDHILNDMDLSELPNVVEFEKRFAWTVEESLAFVAAKGTLAGVPAKALKKSRPQAQDAEVGDTGEEETSAPVEYQQVSVDDIPF